MAGRFAEARAHLESITNSMYADLKRRLTRKLDEDQSKSKGTNAASEITEPKPRAGGLR